MSRFWIISKRQIQWFAVAMFAVMLTIAYLRWEQSKPVASALQDERIINIVTGEFKTKTAAGKEIEVYRWDPGTVFAKAGENIKLSIFGVNGAHHQFYIEGTEIRGEVMKGKETVVHFTPTKKGIYRLICTTHPGHNSKTDSTVKEGDTSAEAPMIGYIVVE
ncbi:hypothetical protein BVG16_24685 [Paenibacillus selenitireducens]|jgi:heme/copper-type cytochrome/quinol oxidase subunit 2|uniref:EfeO-type cupredoxin-like domain-containing protein n=1 Tax=Paenibacillus selenitireducens TaxID=1324314 RepID=A0A1T2X399_9BACL|nr:cupredoxin domain-containing protein [Paenibacillus selenitireducens]OPA74322.1 hypothetical protein BVG16_24685 [Paenibacillus selenitireducens]